MEREEIIRDVARTLFVCAWADGVEAGEIAGEGPGAGGDWMDAAPRTWERNGVTLSNYARMAGWTETPDPDAEREARRIVDGFNARAFRPSELRDRPDETYVPPIEDAARIHGGERFAHELAMTALGSGVTFDVYPRELPGWIRESVCSSDFGAHDLDPERYPVVDWSKGTRKRVVMSHQTPGQVPFSRGEVVTLLEDAHPGGWDVFDVRREDGSEESLYGFNLAPCLPGTDDGDEVTP